MTILAATLPQPQCHSRVAPKQATTNDRSPHSHSPRSHSPCLYLHLFFSLLISRCLFSFIVFLLFAWRGICLFVVAAVVVWGPGPNKQQRRRLPVCCLLSAWHFSRFANHPQKHALNSDIAQLRPLLTSFPASPTPAPRWLSMWVRRLPEACTLREIALHMAQLAQSSRCIELAV